MTGASSVTFRQRRTEIVDADAPARPEAPRRQIGQLIAEAREPERPAALGQPHHVVFVDRNASSFERAPRDRRPLPLALHRLVFPLIMIAEHRMDAERARTPPSTGAHSLQGMKRVTWRCPAT